VTVAQRDWHNPIDLGAGQNVLVALPRHIVGGVANPKNRIEQKLNRTGTCTHDQIRPRYGVGKAGLGTDAYFLNALGTT
jgi:hypothetical protein